MGMVFVDGEYFCYSLEDVARPVGVKFKGETCLSEGVYKMGVTHSPRFDKSMIQLFTEGDYSINKGGIVFTGVRLHGGNDVDDSEGCPLLGANSNYVDRVSNCAGVNKRLIELVQYAENNGDDCIYVISS
jgi:hypothetical protein